MKADITRTTFHPDKHYSRVIAQQGRVQIDADWNEQVSISNEYLRRLAMDLIGPCGGPQADLGFAITPIDVGGGPSATDFAIGPGVYYVDGIRCELRAHWLDATPVKDGKNQIAVTTLMLDGIAFDKDQYLTVVDPDNNKSAQARIVSVDYAKRILTLTDIAAFGAAKPAKLRLRRLTRWQLQPQLAAPALATGRYHVYLDVWERLVTCIEDDSIREVALEGPDTGARGQIVWQVRTLPAGEADECLLPGALGSMLQPDNRGLLRARARPEHSDTDPCIIAPDASYRGPENQLYRVEIHTGNVGGPAGAKPSFKWSRDNGSVTFPIARGGGSNVLILESLGRDDRLGLNEGDWVEVVDDAYVLQGRSTPLLQVHAIDRGRMAVTLSGTPAGDVGKDPALHPLLRRWDHKAGDPDEGGLDLGPDNAALIPAEMDDDAWIDLEDGVQVQFVAGPDAVYRSGDYWLIPARVATGDVEWPNARVPDEQGALHDQGVALSPLGIAHSYAPLAVIEVAGDGVDVAYDCRLQFAALTAPRLRGTARKKAEAGNA